MWKKRLLQFSLFWLYTIFSLVLPCVLLIEKYGLFKQDAGGEKIAFGLLFSIILALFYFRKHISKFIDGMTPCALKSILVATREMVPLILLYGAFFGAKYLIVNQAETALFIVEWTCAFNIIGYIIRVVHLRYRDKVNEDYNVDLVKKAINETK